MSQTDFEPIYEGVKTAMASIAQVKTVSRRFRHYSQTSPADCPAIFITQKGEQVVNQKGIPGKWHLKLDLFVYIHIGDDQTAIPSTVLNGVLRDMRAVLLPDPVSGVPAAFNGLVSHAWIGDEVEIFDGVAGSLAMAVVPLEILTV